MFSVIVMTALGALPGAPRTAPAVAKTASPAYQTAPAQATQAYYGNPYVGQASANYYCAPFDAFGPYCPTHDVDLFLPCPGLAPCPPFAPPPPRPVGAPRVNTYPCPTPIPHCPCPPPPGYAPCP